MNLKLKSYITNGNDILNEDDVYEALTFEGGIAGSMVILFDGANLKGPVLQNGKEFKASKTGVRETHEVNWMNETPRVYTISDVTPPEVVTRRKINGYKRNELQTTIIKSHASSRNALFVSDDKVRANNTLHENNDDNENEYATAIKSALQIADADFGTQNDAIQIQPQYELLTNEMNTYFSPGWARYPKQKRDGKSLSLPTMQFLHVLFMEGNRDKARRVTADRAVIRLRIEVIASDWYEQAFATEQRVKAFFGLSATAQQKLIHAKINAEGDQLEVDGDVWPVEDGEIAQVQNEFETIVKAEMDAAANIMAEDEELLDNPLSEE